MAYETKVILTLLADKAARAKDTKEVYTAIQKAASVEGLKLPSFDEVQKELEEEQKNQNKET